MIQDCVHSSTAYQLYLNNFSGVVKNYYFSLNEFTNLLGFLLLVNPNSDHHMEAQWDELNSLFVHIWEASYSCVAYHHLNTQFNFRFAFSISYILGILNIQ